MAGKDVQASSIHATVVAVDGRGLLIRGPSGSGKSSLALMLMATGAVLVADDRVCLARRGDVVLARAPAPLAGLIEARGVGILRAAVLPEAPVHMVADLAGKGGDRLPPLRHTSLLGVDLPLVLGRADPHLCAALRQMLIGGRMA
ncbi:MAG TPA: serine kinase [Paracoccus sp. (in: a-proteobacteria)]|nr:serine kinase [Paracoccus sp. (in: a-proteobacteria)]